MSQIMTEALVDAGRHRAFALIEEVVEHLAAGPYVSHIHLCGPAAHGDPVPVEGITLAVAVHDRHVADLWQVLDPLVLTDLGAVLPGWQDRRCASADREAVYLIGRGSTLTRLRIRVMPTSMAGCFPPNLPTRLIYGTEPAADRPSDAVPRPAEPGSAPRPTATAAELLVELLCLLHQASDRAHRGLFLESYGDMADVRAALRDLVALSLGETVPGGSWYGIDAALSHTTIGRACRRELRNLVSSLPSGEPAQISAILDTCLRVVRLTAPQVLTELSGQIDSYRRYLDIPADERTLVAAPTGGGA
ncbi:hypothetical protein [Mangrovihabitans endophyticus]|uniref:Uncharacterized protein n=1 Tax=Mangrovihabitans endophyticus TaxID=1751298 RepID=A0A8J3FKW6_9ACTN|nr:hypothetical protein [Mangrovihabitans endophyticus]GGK73185.1 hypothetical protein GCM10012284_03840 [Mangrovihabitans endophyticus]